jgi:hypothetical protein
MPLLRPSIAALALTAILPAQVTANGTELVDSSGNVNTNADLYLTDGGNISIDNDNDSGIIIKVMKEGTTPSGTPGPGDPNKAAEVGLEKDDGEEGGPDEYSGPHTVPVGKYDLWYCFPDGTMTQGGKVKVT